MRLDIELDECIFLWVYSSFIPFFLQNIVLTFWQSFVFLSNLWPYSKGYCLNLVGHNQTKNGVGMLAEQHLTTWEWKCWWTCLVDLGRRVWVSLADPTVTLFCLFHYLFLSDLTLMLIFLLISYCSSPWGIICNSANPVTRNGLLWHSRKYPGTYCNCRECVRCRGATSRKYWTVVYGYSLLYDYIAPGGPRWNFWYGQKKHQILDGNKHLKFEFFWNELASQSPTLSLPSGQKRRLVEVLVLQFIVHTMVKSICWMLKLVACYFG